RAGRGGLGARRGARGGRPSPYAPERTSLGEPVDPGRGGGHVGGAADYPVCVRSATGSIDRAARRRGQERARVHAAKPRWKRRLLAARVSRAGGGSELLGVVVRRLQGSESGAAGGLRLVTGRESRLLRMTLQ